MKITSFNPLIATKDAPSAIKLFEELGFERRHTIAGKTNKINMLRGRADDIRPYGQKPRQYAQIPRD